MMSSQIVSRVLFLLCLLSFTDHVIGQMTLEISQVCEDILDKVDENLTLEEIIRSQFSEHIIEGINTSRVILNGTEGNIRYRIVIDLLDVIDNIDPINGKLL